MERICLLGASGSVGESALRVLKKFPEKFSLESFSVNTNVVRAKEIIDEFSPEIVCVSDETADKSVLGTRYKNTEIIYGQQNLAGMVKDSSAGTVLTAVVGSVGIMPTVETIKSGKKLAVANKETLVTFGPYIKKLLETSSSVVVPVDSEHNALFQLVENTRRSSIKTLTLTASGGSFRDWPLEKLKNVTVAEALNHPTWNMGPKITIDSAGLINKGLEVIEAHFLFDFDYEDIEIVIHPESIVHGMIELNDGAYLSYNSHPDMMYPIAHSLFYPDSVPEKLHNSKPFSWKQLTFRKPDEKRYPAIRLAYEAGKTGGTAPAVFNAANEVAVESFLNGQIPFLAIPEMIDYSLNNMEITWPDSLEEFLETDRRTRSLAANKIKSRVS